MKNWFRSELKRANKEKKRCKKLYKDWVDDEFNCGPNKFIFGVIADSNKYVESSDDVASFETLNDLVIYFNRDTRKYLLDLEVGYNLYEESDADYLERLLKAFRCFIENEYHVSNINMFIKEDLYVYINDMSNYWSANDLITLYCKFYIFVRGFKQNLRNKKQMENKVIDPT